MILTLLGILAPSLLIVVAVRRWIVPVPFRIAALFIALTLLFLHGAVFTSKLPLPVDEVARGYPWRGLFGDVAPRNPLTNDAVKLFLPWMQVAREELFHFRAPLWNRYSFSGYPLLGNGESAPFSPLFLATLFVPLPKQIVAMAGLKLFSALLFTYLFARREGAGETASVFASIAFAFSAAMAVFLYYSAASVIAFLPAAAFSLFHAMDAPRKSSVVLVALVIGTLMANGHPESVLHTAVACLTLLLIDFALTADSRGWLRRCAFPLVGVAAGLALSAPAWVPVAQQVRLSARYAELREGAHFGGLPPTAAWALLNPNGFGHPLRHNYAWIVNYSTVAQSYAGLLALVLFVTALVAPRTSIRDRFFAAAAVLLFLIAADWTVIGHAIYKIPPFSIAANDKLRFAALFIAIIVAAKVIDTSRWLVAACAAPLVSLTAFVLVRHWTVMTIADAAGIAAVMAFLFLPQRFAPAIAAAELFIFFAGFNALVDAKYFRPDLPLIEALRARAPGEPFRVVGRDWVLLPNASAQYGLEDIRGSDPMAFAAYDSLLRNFTVQERGTWVRRVVDVDRPELDRLNVRFLIAEPDFATAGKWRLIYRGADGTLWENSRVEPRFYASGARFVTHASGSARFTLDMAASAPMLILSSEPYGPGWRVRLDGRTIPSVRIDGLFLGFRSPAGHHRVVVDYWPVAFYASVAVALAGVAMLTMFRTRPAEIPPN
jgi:Bacterial membrane protein YfhO